MLHQPIYVQILRKQIRGVQSSRLFHLWRGGGVWNRAKLASLILERSLSCLELKLYQMVLILQLRMENWFKGGFSLYLWCQVSQLFIEFNWHGYGYKEDLLDTKRIFILCTGNMCKLNVKELSKIRKIQ